MKVEIVTISKFVNPGFRLSKRTWQQIGRAVVAGIIDNVVRQRQVDGSALKPNSPNYREQKRRAGFTHRGQVLSLVRDKHRFTRRANWQIQVKSDSCVVRPSTTDFADIVRQVQERDYTGWYGVSLLAVKAIRETLREFVKQQLKKAQR